MQSSDLLWSKNRHGDSLPCERLLKLSLHSTFKVGLIPVAVDSTERALRIKKKGAAKHPRRARGSLSREEIIEAATAIVNEDGVEAMSMRRVAERLGCSVASPYAHFENQEEIMRLLVLNGETRLTYDLRQAQTSSANAYEQLDAIAHSYWNFASKNRQLHRLMFSASGGKLYRKSFPTLPTSYRVFLETIRRGISSGAIPYTRKSYPAIARTMWSWMYGLIVLDLNGMIRHPQGADPVAEGIALFTKLLKSGESPAYDRRRAARADFKPAT